jgi:hypothetical protein
LITPCTGAPEQLAASHGPLQSSGGTLQANQRAAHFTDQPPKLRNSTGNSDRFQLGVFIAIGQL